MPAISPLNKTLILISGCVVCAAMPWVVRALEPQAKGIGITAMVLTTGFAWLLISLNAAAEDAFNRNPFGALMNFGLGWLPLIVGLTMLIVSMLVWPMRGD